jgi:hypothetical protein
MPAYNPSALGNMVTEMTPQAAQHLPFRYTDETYINIPIPIEEDDWNSNGTKSNEYNPITTDEDSKKRKGSWVGKLGRKLTGKTDQKFKIVRMTRGEYLAKWARDEDGNYIGTDPVPGRLTKADL